MATTGTGLRTIWITLRAANYTTRVFTDAITQLNFLSKAELRLVQNSMRMATAALSAGIMFGVLSKEMGGTAGEVLKYTSYLMYLVSAIEFVKSAQIILSKVNWSHMLSVQGLTVSYSQLAISIMAGLGVFLLLVNQLGPLPAMLFAIAAAVAVLAVQLWFAAGAVSVLTLGLAAIAGGAAIAGAIAAASGARTFQMGTRMTRATGPAWVHKGEVIYNPSTGRPTQIGKDLEGKGTTVYNDINIPIENVHTKADFDDLDEKLRKSLGKAARKNR